MMFTSADMQNEILQVMALGFLRQVAKNIRDDGRFTIMADETTDQSNREQVVIVLRRVDSDLTVYEEFIGLYVVPSTDVQISTNVIMDTLIRMNLTLSNCRGQCYDGASSMSGAKKGVAVNISSRESRAVYTHCYGHALNLAVSVSVKGFKVMRDSLDSVYEISKLIKYSPRRDTKLEELKTEMNPDKPGFRVLCPTRWTVRAASLCSVLDNYSVLQSLWEICYEFVKDSETRARIVCVHSQMFSFDFLFGVSLGYEVFRHTDNLSKALQHKRQRTRDSRSSVTTRSNLRQEQSYDKFWADVTKN
ncbi:zinc finger MYM-type protein 1-like [Gigantopelta aegis]|uniref:zinc finger MYM-type protein 1-like n=1 Tax=Gigantopelta aegis TaxID=1735272 RepID=UPI001B88E4CE|nr:zinc finger MYM-type protein 1-like [Gigantopelta aegis]